MTNKEIAQEQINKEKEEARIKYIKRALSRKEELIIETERNNKYLEELENCKMKEIFGSRVKYIPDTKEYLDFCE